MWISLVEVSVGVVANGLNRDILESEFKLQSHYFVHFRISTVGKGMSPLSLRYGLNSKSIIFFTGMAVALNNTGRLIWHQIKKQNRTWISFLSTFFFFLLKMSESSIGNIFLNISDFNVLFCWFVYYISLFFKKKLMKFELRE